MNRKSKPFIKHALGNDHPDDLIQEMIEKRKLQQEALLKIINSIEAEDRKIVIKKKSKPRKK